MPSKRKSPLAVKIIVCLLLLGSFAAFAMPWLKLASYKEAEPTWIRMSPGELIRNFTGMDADAVKDSARTAVKAAGLGRETTLRALDSVLDRTLDGRFTLPGLALLCRDGAQLCADFQRPDEADMLQKASYAVWGVLGLLGLFGLLALLCQLSDQRWGILLYFLFGAMVTAGLLFLRKEANATLLEQSDSLLSEWGLSGLTGYLKVDLALVKMGIGAYLCPFLAFLALLLSGIRKRTPAPPLLATPYPARRPTASPSAAPARTPSRPASQPAPQTVFCPNCGKKLPGNAAFCTSCGRGIRRGADAGSDEERFRFPGEDGR